MKGAEPARQSHGHRIADSQNGFGGASLPKATQPATAESFIADSLLLLTAAREDRETPRFTSQAELMSRLAVSSLVAADGDTKRASASAGILEPLLVHWVKTAERENRIPGLLASVTSRDSIAQMHLPAREKWPADFTFAEWNSLGLRFKPASQSSRPVPTPPKRPETAEIIRVECAPLSRRTESGRNSAPTRTTGEPHPSASHGSQPLFTIVPLPELKPDPLAVANPIEYLRGKFEASYRLYKSFDTMEWEARSGHPAADPPEWPAVREAFFYQIFGSLRGSLEAMRRNFPADPEFIKELLAPYGAQRDEFFPQLFSRTLALHTDLKNRIFQGFPGRMVVSELFDRWRVVVGQLPPPRER